MIEKINLYQNKIDSINYIIIYIRFNILFNINILFRYFINLFKTYIKTDKYMF